MIKKLKKGFTIVELVIVIAIVAILAAVLVPTFANIIDKANVSADTMLVRNLNTALKTDNQEHKTMTSALQAAKDAGYDISRINAQATNSEILWDSLNDTFCYEKDGEIVYLPEITDKKEVGNNTYYYWQITNKGETLNTVYSNYLAADYVVSGTLEISTGLDVGEVTGINSIEYTGTNGQNVTIRTNGGTLTIDAPEDEIDHYGEAQSINLIRVKQGTYNEYGAIEGDITLSQGKINLHVGSSVNNVVIKGQTALDGTTTVTPVAEKINVSIESGSTVNAVNSAVEGLSLENVVAGTGSANVTQIDTTSDKLAYIGKNGYDTLSAALQAVTSGTHTVITLAQDVTLSSDCSIGNGKDITLNLNGHSVTHAGNKVFKIDNAKVHFTGKGKISENVVDGYAPILIKGSTDPNAKDYTVVTVDSEITLLGDYAGLFIDQKSEHAYGVVVKASCAIDLSTITGTQGEYYGAGVYINGQIADTTGYVPQIELDGVTIKGADTGIYAAGYGEWKIRNCTIEGFSTAIELRAGKMTIDGGEYTAITEEYDSVANGNGTTMSGCAFAVAQHTTKLPIAVEINGGTFTGVKSVVLANPQANETANVQVVINDGTFNNEIVNYTPDNQWVLVINNR